MRTHDEPRRDELAGAEPLTPAELRAGVIELAEALTRWAAAVNLRLRCTPEELAAAFPEGAAESYVYDGDGVPAYVLETYRVSLVLPGRSEVTLAPRYPRRRAATGREIRQLRAARPHPRSLTLSSSARPVRLDSRPPGVPA